MRNTSTFRVARLAAACRLPGLLLCWLLLPWLLPVTAAAQQSDSAAQQSDSAAAKPAVRLIQETGHLHLGQQTSGDTTWVYYEDRYSVNPVAEALRLQARLQDRLDDPPQDRPVILVPTWNQQSTRGAHKAARVNAAPPAFASPRTTVDFTLHPQVRWQIGFFEDYLRTNPRLAPEITLRRGGFTASAQWVFPLDQELPEPQELYHREHHPGIIRAGYLARLGPKTFASLDAGFFTRNRYGYQASVRRYMGRTIVGLDLGLTGYYSFFRGDADYSELNIVTPLADVIHQMPWYNIVARVRAGKFLAQSADRLRLGEYLVDDWGVRVDVLRRFGSVEIGGFMRTNEAEYSTGITLVIPLVRGVSWGSGRASARVRPLAHFEWDFGRTRRGDFSRPERGGRLFRTGRDWDTLDRMMSPIYWRMMERIETSNSGKASG